MSGPENRRAERIGCERLPASLQRMVMIFDTGERNQVDTFDASTLGLGLRVPLAVPEMEEHVGILLESIDGSFKLLGEVVFCMAIDVASCRIGVQFSQTLSTGTYKELLATATTD